LKSCGKCTRRCATNLKQGVDHVLTVVRPGDDVLTQRLQIEGLEIVVSPNAAEGMGCSLACGVAATRKADGWLIAPADMSWIGPDTIRAMAGMLANGAPLVAPYYAGRRGHPVGFAKVFKADLLRLTGNSGARDLLHAHRDSLQQFIATIGQYCKTWTRW
jgi:molybdenum cofactor cytidylyltransferase